MILAGDARHDSPGHCATYGTYTLLDTQSNMILSQETVKCTEVANSYWLEIEGLNRTLTNLISHGNNVSILTTDRHGGVRKLMNQQYDYIVHEYDLWHIIKGVKKKICKTGIKQLIQWLPAITNHLWYCAATCRGNASLLKVMWRSLLYHITNRHEWGLAMGDDFVRCAHDPYSEEEEMSRPWLTENSTAFEKLQSIVTSKNLLTDLAKVSIKCDILLKWFIIMKY